MRRHMASSVRTGLAAGVALAAAAGAWAQLPAVSIDDVRVVEGNGPLDQTVTVSLLGPTASDVQVKWTTVDGSAKAANNDFVPNSSTVTFPPSASPQSQTFTVRILGDLTPEWNPTLQMDEAFFIDLDPPTTNNATLLKSRATVTIVDDDRSLPGLQYVSAVADGTATLGRVRLQWRVPVSSPSGPVEDVLVRWNIGSPTCSAPTDTVAPAAGQFYVDFGLGIAVKPAGETQVVEHLIPSPHLRHCYALFAVYSAKGPSGTPTTELPPTVAATPFDSAPPNAVAWAYSVGTPSGTPCCGPPPTVVAPTVGTDAVYTISNDGVVHAMTRGANGGTWPQAPPALEAWNPVGLGRPASNRSPVVPLQDGPRLFVGTANGEVHAVNGRNGSIAWSRSAAFGAPLDSTGGVQATPAGLFSSWGGNNDLILVGTYAAPPNNKFHMLNPETGIDRAPAYSTASMGAILGMAAVDYPRTVYFLTNSTTGTLWALDLGAKDLPGFSLSTLPPPMGNPVPLAVGSNGSPVVRNGRIYLGAGADVVMYPAPDGLSKSSNLSDGEIKGFVFPDRRNTNIYFSTTGTASTKGTVWGFKDTVDTLPSPFTYLWSFNSLTSTAILSPSIVLHWPGTNFIYVGGGEGRLWQIELDPATWHPKLPLKYVQLEPPNNQIGAPSLDGQYNLVLVGSVNGVIYAVRTDPTAGVP